MRRLAIALGGLLLSAVGLLSLGAGHAHAQGTPPPAEGPVDIVEVSGLVDDVVADDLTKAIARAERGGAQALIVQMNSKGAVVSPERMARLAEAIHGARCRSPLGRTSGSRALGLTGQLLGGTRHGDGPRHRIGDFGTPLPVQGFELDFGNGGDQLRS